MRIIKHGTLPERNFTCETCGCEFVANCKEYDRDDFPNYHALYKTRFRVICPDCGSEIINYIEK